MIFPVYELLFDSTNLKISIIVVHVCNALFYRDLNVTNLFSISVFCMNAATHFVHLTILLLKICLIWNVVHTLEIFYGFVKSLMAFDLLDPIRASRLKFRHTVNIGIFEFYFGLFHENLFILTKKTYLKCENVKMWQFFFFRMTIQNFAIAHFYFVFNLTNNKKFM